MKDKNKAAVELGKKSAKARGFDTMTREQRSEYMKRVRARMNPVKPPAIVRVSGEVN